jgi:hypothetical protein
MTSEQIAAIRQATKDVQAFRDQQEIALKEFRDKTLNPLVAACDHTFHTFPLGRRCFIRT